MEKKVETTIVCWGYIGIMETKTETTFGEKSNRLNCKAVGLIMNE